jgi:AraC-like DNA-binding protein
MKSSTWRSTVSADTNVARLGQRKDVAVRPVSSGGPRHTAPLLSNGVAPDRHAEIAKRFVAAVEATLWDPLLTIDPCRALGVPGRTLRSVCQEQLGTSPRRFVTLRRLNLIRRALLGADHHLSTVTSIATGYGVWELGRFAVAYKSLLGESPSATLIRPVEKAEAVAGGDGFVRFAELVGRKRWQVGHQVQLPEPQQASTPSSESPS